MTPVVVVAKTPHWEYLAVHLPPKTELDPVFTVVRYWPLMDRSLTVTPR